MIALSWESASSPPSAERNSEGDLGAGVAAAEPEQDQHHQHLADEIVVERRKELAPEQRREPPRRHQRSEHPDPDPVPIHGDYELRKAPPSRPRGWPSGDHSGW